MKRVKQFIRGLFARLTENDYTFIADYLTKDELDLFKTMSRYDRKHALDVGRYLAGHGAGLPLIRAGLLHDIGKANCPELTLIRRSVCVAIEAYKPEEADVLAKKGKGKLARAINVHKNHPELGAAILEELAADPYIIGLVRFHQNGEAPTDVQRDLGVLRDADDRF
ncbi:MAG: HD domain-containing protein [Actinomycetota bacterium]